MLIDRRLNILLFVVRLVRRACYLRPLLCHGSNESYANTMLVHNERSFDCNVKIFHVPEAALGAPCFVAQTSTSMSVLSHFQHMVYERPVLKKYMRVYVDVCVTM